MPNHPVIVGVAQLTNRLKSLDQAIEPSEMMAGVARAAAADAGNPDLLTKIDSVQVVNMLSWSYADLPGLLAQKIGASPAHKLYSAIGGDTPQRLVNETSQAIVEGRTRLALITGAEVMATRSLAHKQSAKLAWERGTPIEVTGDTRNGFTDVEARHGAVLPTRVYPLFENAIRAHLGHSIEEHQRYVGELCARFTQAAAANPYAWFPEARTAEEITAVTPNNRWVGFPYPKLMNSIIEVDQAAALILTGSDTARELGIPEDRWVYIRGAGEANEKWFVSDRVNYHSSPAIKAATSRALTMAGLAADDIDFFDLYSCFPAAVQYGLGALGIATTDLRPLTVTGGLPYAGGPGNNYVTHSIAATVDRVRRAPEQRALVTGLGWFATKHSAGVYSGRPPTGDWRRTDSAADQAIVDADASPPFVPEAAGDATIETYTVAFGRDGEPEVGIVIGRLATGQRFFANTPPDADLLRSMTQHEFVGRTGRVEFDAGTQKNTFSPD